MKEIYLDMDGVLVNSHWNTVWSHGYHGRWPTGYHTGRVLSEFCNFHDFSWDKLGFNAWAWFTKTSLCDALIDECVMKVGRENVSIATRPTTNPESWSGKFAWIVENLPEWIHFQVVMTHDKSKLARPGAFLIDDDPKNCHRFCDAGGNAICVPRPWQGFDNIDDNKILERVRLQF